MSGEFHDQYVADLECISEEIVSALENMLSILDDDRDGLVSPLFAKNQAALLIDQYHEFKQDNCGD